MRPPRFCCTGHCRRREDPSPGRQAPVYDPMEPYRPKVDGEVLALILSQVFGARDFVIDAKGACRLHPEQARD